MNTQLKNLRKQFHLSQEQMASLAGVHRTTWGAYERGERTPPIQIIKTLSRNLSIPFQDLMKDEFKDEFPLDSPAITPEETAMIHAFRSLDSAGKEYILREMVREEGISEYYNRRRPLG